MVRLNYFSGRLTKQKGLKHFLLATMWVIFEIKICLVHNKKSMSPTLYYVGHSTQYAISIIT